MSSKHEKTFTPPPNDPNAKFDSAAEKQPTDPLPDPDAPGKNSLSDLWDTVSPHIGSLIYKRGINYTSIQLVDGCILIIIPIGSTSFEKLAYTTREILFLLKPFKIKDNIRIKWAIGN